MAEIKSGDANHSIIRSFDEATDSLKTTITNADVNINVSAFTDSIAIADDSGNKVTTTLIGSKQSLDVNVADITLDKSNDSVTAHNPEELSFVDENSETITYIGAAAPGTSQASAGWKIKRILISGTVTQISYASGNSNYDKVWNDRASLSYN